MIDWENLHSLRVVVLGAAKSGLAAAHFLKSRVKGLAISDVSLIPEDAKNILIQEGIFFEEGGHDQATLDQADFFVVSPGIPMTAPPIRWAHKNGVPVISEIELASQFLKAKTVAITGSNGKTTTVHLMTEVLRAAGHKVKFAGNIGVPLISLVEEDLDYIVLELSSFQLETTFSFQPTVALFLNLYSNHLNRHGDMETYYTLKKRLFLSDTEQMTVVLNADNTWTEKIAGTLTASTYLFGRSENTEHLAHLSDEDIFYRYLGETVPIMSRSELLLYGQHNLENYLAVAAVCSVLKVSQAALYFVFSQFKGVEHRLEHVRELKKVTYINDSKATNYLATQKAIESFSAPLILIAGGEDKGGDFDGLAQTISQCVKAVVLIGSSAELFQKKLQKMSYHHTQIQDTMKSAVEFSFQEAEPGDVVLLSPACASYDMYANFEKRGEDYKLHVNSLRNT